MTLSHPSEHATEKASRKKRTTRDGGVQRRSADGRWPRRPDGSTFYDLRVTRVTPLMGASRRPPEGARRRHFLLSFFSSRSTYSMIAWTTK